jgi:hypothetical protein
VAVGGNPVAEVNLLVEATEDEINAGEPEPIGWQPVVPAGVDFTGTRRLCTDVLARLPVHGAAVSVRGGGPTTALLHATDAVIARLDDLQFVLGEGPCQDAYRLRTPVLEPDLTSAAAVQRWPVFGREAVPAGAAAVFAFPLQTGAVPFGVLELYRKTPGGLAAPEVAAAVFLADAGAGLVLDDVAGADLTPTVDDPDPLFGRDEVPVATGMIAVQLGVTIDRALIELRAAAFTSNRPITDVAADVLAGRITLRPPGPPDRPASR